MPQGGLGVLFRERIGGLKFLKRQMYGRASVELLRLRVLRPN